MSDEQEDEELEELKEAEQDHRRPPKQHHRSRSDMEQQRISWYSDREQEEGDVEYDDGSDEERRDEFRSSKMMVHAM